MSWRIRSFRLLAIAAGAYALVCVVVFIFQRRLIYFPSREPYELPSGFSAWTNASGELHGYKRQENSDTCLFFIHGNGGNARGWAQAVADFPGDVFVLEFPGYGERPGTPSEESIKATALSAFEAEPRQYRKIILCGQSLGSGVTPAIFEKHPSQVHALVLITPFPSLDAVAKARFPFLPTSLLLRDHYALFDAWKSFAGRSYVVMAAEDEIIPPELCGCYVREKNERRTVTILEGATHNGIDLPSGFWSEVAK